MRAANWVGTSLWMIAACGGASGDEAQKELEADGYTEVAVEAGEESGKFRFTARNAEGKACTGSITMTRSGGSSSKMVSSMCQ